MSPRHVAPVVVTGIPRSGTTWLARLLAAAPATAMLGREPMNPRAGQWALAGHAQAWTRWTDPPPAARRTLARTYRGHAPRAYGRLGVRQWRAALPGTRLIVKDPFALLSLPAVVTATGAVPVVLYRSPDAVLGSYRRMGWRADVAEFRALGAPMPPEADEDDVVAMGMFWSWAHATVLDDLEHIPQAVVVSHPELTTGGVEAHRALLETLGLDARHLGEGHPADRSKDEPVREGRLHNLDRSPEQVMSSSKQRVGDDERRVLQEMTGDVSARLDGRRLRVLG